MQATGSPDDPRDEALQGRASTEWIRGDVEELSAIDALDTLQMLNLRDRVQAVVLAYETGVLEAERPMDRNGHAR